MKGARLVCTGMNVRVALASINRTKTHPRELLGHVKVAHYKSEENNTLCLLRVLLIFIFFLLLFIFCQLTTPLHFAP